MKITNLVLVLALASCAKEQVIPPSYEEQLKLDKKIIDDYLATEGITNVIKDTSGLRLVIHQLGTGEVPNLTSNVKVEYEVSLLSTNQLIDKSPATPVYFQFQIADLIAGWRIALREYLPVGSTATLYIPSGLAYGANVVGPVPAYSNLISYIDFKSSFNEGEIADESGNYYSPSILNNLGQPRPFAVLNKSLETTRYLNGESLDVADFSSCDLPAKVYSFASVTDGRGLCPQGYRVPTKAEWELFGNPHAVVELFGFQDPTGVCTGVGDLVKYWSSTEVAGSNEAYAYNIDGTGQPSVTQIDKNSKAHVVCIK